MCLKEFSSQQNAREEKGLESTNIGIFETSDQIFAPLLRIIGMDISVIVISPMKVAI